MNKMSWFKKSLFAFLSIMALGAGIYYYMPRGPIYEYNEMRDTQDILDLFKHHWYWLTASEDYSPEFMLKYRTDKKNPMYFGKMKIKVLREQDQFIGFVAYFMESSDVGVVRFVAVKEGLRGKRYGEQLLKYAINDLIKMGAHYITLVTRTINYAAQKLYIRVGFKETLRDEEFVYYTYYVK